MTLSSWRDRRGVLEALATLFVSRVAVAVVPLRWLRRLAQDGPPSTTARDRHAAEHVKARIGAVSTRVQWLSGCLPQSIAAAAMLRLRGVRPTLHFGVLKGRSTADSLAAHAWLTVGDVVVTGEGLESAFLELRTNAFTLER